jgi:demethylmenaquinone methyltransferase / 2-methoxy-6-polyprenyl-1,4-benzoquinol methylase
VRHVSIAPAQGVDVTDAADARNRFARRLFSPLPPRYDRLAEVLSFGQNVRWRRAMVEHVVAARPRRILDVASGPAGVALLLAQRTSAEVVGIDLTEDMLRQGQRNVRAAGLEPRIRLVLGRGEQLPFADGTFDALTFTYLLRYVEDPQATLIELVRVLEPGGVIASQEFFVPPRTFWRACWWLYTRAVLPVGGALLGGAAWYRVGRFLGPSISGHYRHYPLDWTIGAWQRAGLEGVQCRVMSLGGGLVMWARKPGA